MIFDQWTFFRKYCNIDQRSTFRLESYYNIQFVANCTAMAAALFWTNQISHIFRLSNARFLSVTFQKQLTKFLILLWGKAYIENLLKRGKVAQVFSSFHVGLKKVFRVQNIVHSVSVHTCIHRCWYMYRLFEKVGALWPTF